MPLGDGEAADDEMAMQRGNVKRLTCLYNLVARSSDGGGRGDVGMGIGEVRASNLIVTLQVPLAVVDFT